MDQLNRLPTLKYQPKLELGGGRQRLLERATLALGRLDSVATFLPDPQLFLYAYVRREAALSSQIDAILDEVAEPLRSGPSR